MVSQQVRLLWRVQQKQERWGRDHEEQQQSTDGRFVERQQVCEITGHRYEEISIGSV
jgi:hypothetical protein